MSSNLGAKFASLVLAAAASVFSFAPVAQATPVNYDFTVQATSGGLTGAPESGSFSYESTSIVPGGTNTAKNLLTSLGFAFNGIAYDATTANTGFLSFNAAGELVGFSFGSNCFVGICRLRPGNESWLVDPNGFAYTGQLPNGRFTAGSGSLTYALASVSVPEPATLGLFALGALMLGLFAGARRRIS